MLRSDRSVARLPKGGLNLTPVHPGITECLAQLGDEPPRHACFERMPVLAQRRVGRDLHGESEGSVLRVRVVDGAQCPASPVIR